jgi:hypothetical protein
MKRFKRHDIDLKGNGTDIGGGTFASGFLKYCCKITGPVTFYQFPEVGFVNSKEWNFSEKN